MNTMARIRIMQDMSRKFEENLPIKVPNFSKRVRITSDVDKFKWKEEVSVWEQMQGKAALNFEVLFDGEFVCFFDTNDTEDVAITRMLEGFLKLYKEKKIYVNEEVYALIRKEQQEKERIAELPTPHTEDEKLVAQAMEKKFKKQGKKVVYKE